MQNEESQGGPVGVVGELQHRGVAVGVSRSEHRASADPVPDPYGLLRTVVKVVELGLVGDGAPVVVAGVAEGAAAADDPLAGDAVHLHAYGPHKVPTAARDDIGGEAVGRQEVEQLDHRRVRTLQVASTEAGMLR